MLEPNGGGFALNAHANSAGNRNAFCRKAITLEDYRQAAMVCEPLNLFDLAPSVDGAAAVVLARREALAANPSHPPVRLTASAAAGDALALHDRPDPLDFGAARRSASAALAKANLRPEQVDLFEYCDSSSIHAALSLEAAGFAGHGEGWKLAAEQAIAPGGQIPCASFGGCKGRGHPLGASGVYQCVEATLQLRGSAGRNQIGGARVAMIQSLSGAAAVAVTHILERLEKE